MVAVIVRSGKGRTIDFRVSERLCLVKVGRNVSARKLRKALYPFGEGYIFSEQFDSSFKAYFTPFDHRSLEEHLLFNAFLKTASFKNFNKVGVVCTNTITPTRAAELLRFISELIIIDPITDEQFLHNCIKQYGTCPDFGTYRDLYSCDAVLSFDGIKNYNGLHFGTGGVTVCGDSLPLPYYTTAALAHGTDTLKLLSLLNAETGGNYHNLTPQIITYNGQKIPLDAFLERKEKILL